MYISICIHLYVEIWIPIYIERTNIYVDNVYI